MAGSTATALGPTSRSSVGTSRQPSSVLAFLGDEPFEELLGGGPVLRRRAAGTRARRRTRPRRAARTGSTLRKNRSGICSRMPAPSPVLASQPQAPRCAQVHQHLQRLLDDRVRAPALDVHDEADAAGVVLVERIVEAGWCRWSGDSGHDRTFIAYPDSEEKYNDHILRITKRNGLAGLKPCATWRRTGPSPARTRSRRAPRRPVPRLPAPRSLSAPSSRRAV